MAGGSLGIYGHLGEGVTQPFIMGNQAKRPWEKEPPTGWERENFLSASPLKTPRRAGKRHPADLGSGGKNSRRCNFADGVFLLLD